MDYLGREQTSRSVVPNWRFFSETMSIGELESNYKNKKPENLYAIDDYIDTWLDKKSFSTAGDLISAAIANGQRNNKYARDAALYIKERQDVSDFPVLERGAMFLLSGTDEINGLWEQFCRQIYFADSEKGEQMSESLLNLPKNPAYRHYFTISDYERITAYEADLHRRANR